MSTTAVSTRVSRRTRARLVVALTCACSTGLSGQLPVTHAIIGNVTSDSAGTHGIGNAELTIPALGIGARSNWMGEFRLNEVPPGRWLVQAKRLGFRSISDSVTVGGGDVSLDFVLQTAPVTLDSVVTRADAQRDVSPSLRGFAERMNAHQGGYFIGDSVLRQNEASQLANILDARAPGLELYNSLGNVYAISTRAGGAAAQCGVFQRCTTPDGKPVTGSKLVPQACYVTIYVDGVQLFDPAQVSPRNPPTSVNSINVADLAGVEYYASPESTPEQYRNTSPCGALLLWTREK